MIFRLSLMVYSITLPYIFIYCSVSILTYIAWFVLWLWLFIIAKFIPIHQKIIYIFSSRFMNRIIALILINNRLPLIFLLLGIFKYIKIRSFFFHYHPPLNLVQIYSLEVLMFRENIEPLPTGESYYLYLDKYGST